MALRCPYCGEPAEVDVDPGGAEVQDYEQDCAVCCRPWQVHVERGEDGEAVVVLRREDE
ncbi:MAG: CPXCG motif-containing cysteine-rich protein [Myxococcales bacterium]